MPPIKFIIGCIMLRIFLKNLFRGLILNAVLVAVIHLLFFVIALFLRVLGIPMLHELFISSKPVYLVMSPVLSFAAGIVIFWLARFFHIPFIFEQLTVESYSYWAKRYDKGKAIKPIQCYLVLLGHIALAVAGGVLAYLAYKNPDMHLPATGGSDINFITAYTSFFMSMGSLAAFQLVYYFASVYQYHYTVCPSCKRMLCLVDEKTVSALSESVTQYKDDSTAYGSTRDVHRISSQIICRCLNCNSKFIHNDVVHYVDPWKEIK